ncbi:MAG: SAV_2336 N-terminal domain-related protein [Cyanobacteria bacterium P01_G01_bin.54]
MKQLLQRLVQSGLDLGDEEIADAIWLAQHLGPTIASRPQPEPEAETLDLPPQFASEGESRSLESEPEPSASVDSAPEPQPSVPAFPADAVRSPGLSEVEERDRTSPGLPFRAPASAALQNPLELGRALRPLMRKVPSRTATILDSAATLEQIAEQQIWQPVLQPAPERWLDLELVVEDSPLSFIWQQTIAEFQQQVLRRQGAFRSVRRWSLQNQGGRPVLLSRQAGTHRVGNPRELVHPAGRRLVVLISDCRSPLWERSQLEPSPHPTEPLPPNLHAWLEFWSRQGHLALMQLLPEWLWKQTALRYGFDAQFTTTTPGVANQQWVVQGLSTRQRRRAQPERAIKLPVLTLQPESLAAWAQVVVGQGRAKTPGVVLNLAQVRRLQELRENTPPLFAEATDAERVDRFLGMASLPAQQLASMMAAVPVSLPVVHLLQRELLPRSTPVNVAEVFMSGLFERLEDDPQWPVYEFRSPEIRTMLTQAVPTYTTHEVINVLSRAIGEKLGRSFKNFAAFLAAEPEWLEQAAGEERLVGRFAELLPEVLRNMGGAYAVLAESAQVLSASRSRTRSSTNRTNRQSISSEGKTDSRTESLTTLYEARTDLVLPDLRLQNTPISVEEFTALNEAKLILVGEGEVGKSSLLGALRGDKWVEGRPTTHGIEIKPVIVNTSDNETEITLNVWNFGGQKVYRPTHQFFFGSPAVYLVIWKPREVPQQGFVGEWIALIKHREPDAKILVVSTYCGPGSRQPDIDRQELIELFSSETILGFFQVDSKLVNGITELKTAIANVASNLPGMGREILKKWQDVRKILQIQNQPCLPYGDVIHLCTEQGIEEKQTELFLRTFHELGWLTHYQYDPILKDIVIFEPDWLAKAISYVFDDVTIHRHNGLVEFDHLSQLWLNPPFYGETGYPADLHPIFLRLMERFDLAYTVILDPISPSKTYLIAQLVSDIRPEQFPDWGSAPNIGDHQQIYICRIVDDRGQLAPVEGLFYQLIVRLHKYSLGRNNYEKSVHWQRGLMLDNDYNGRALLEQINTDIRITVRAAYPQQFLSYLTQEIQWLVENFWKGLKCKIMVPCLSESCFNSPNPGLFEIQKLIECKKVNRSEYPCEQCDDWQNIDQLLNNTPTTPPPSQEIGIEQFRDAIQDELQSIHRDLVRLDHRDRQRYQTLSAGQKAILSRIDQQFSYLMQIFADEAGEGPRLFSFKPVAPDYFDHPKWSITRFQLTLWCEHSRTPLPVLNPASPEQGVYELELSREWFTKAITTFKFITITLSLVLPVATSTTQVLLNEKTYAGIQDELDLGQKSLEFGFTDNIRTADRQGQSDSQKSVWGEVFRVQGSVLREFHTFLREKDPSFGGLIRVQNRRREFLWVHPQFVGEY